MTFLNGIWKKVKYNFQYLNKSVQDGTIDLKYLQFIFIEFDHKYATQKEKMI